MELHTSRAIRKERLFEEDLTYNQIKDVLLGMKVVSIRPGRTFPTRFLVQVNGEHVQTCYTKGGAIDFAVSVLDYVEGDARYNEPVSCVRRPLLFLHDALQPRN